MVDQEKLMEVMLDSIQFFYENQEMYNDMSKKELERRLDQDGNSVVQLFAYVKRHTRVSEWYKEVKLTIKLMRFDELDIQDREKLVNQLSCVDLISGFSSYNLIFGAFPHFNFENLIK